MTSLSLLLVLFSTLVAYVLLKIRKSQRFFQERNVPCVEPTFFFGSRPAGTFLFRHISETHTEIYEQLAPNKIGGFYELFQPFYMIRNPAYVNQVLSSHWTHFHDRGFEVDDKVNPLDGNLAFINGEKYRRLRTAFNPAFAPSKLRGMFAEMVTCTDLLIDHIKENVQVGVEIDLRQPLFRHTFNVIASTVLGYKITTFENPASSKLLEIVWKFTGNSFISGIILFLRLICPSFLRAFKIPTIKAEITEYFTNSIKEAFQRRTEGGASRKDLVQFMLDLKEGKLSEDVDEGDGEIDALKMGEDKPGKRKMLDITVETAAAQAFIFSVGGTDTTYATIYGVIYMVALHPTKQDKARQEVIDLKCKYGGFTYECLSEMTYLSWCIRETLRLVTPVPVLPRVCTKAFEFPDGTTLNVGDRVIIPTFCISRDPTLYPEPLKFIPERFSSPGKPGTFLAFGGGPKICIGMKFAEIEMKLALARLLEIYTFEPALRDLDRTEMDIKFDPKSFLPLPKEGYKVVMRETKRN